MGSYKFEILMLFILSLKIMCLVPEYDQYNRNGLQVLTKLIKFFVVDSNTDVRFSSSLLDVKFSVIH